MQRDSTQSHTQYPGEPAWTADRLPRSAAHVHQLRTRYRKIIEYPLRCIEGSALWRQASDTREDVEQELMLAIHTAITTWDLRRTQKMQFGTYLWWAISKRLSRVRAAHLCADQTEVHHREGARDRA